MNLLQAYLELTKPRLTLLVLLTALAGFMMASQDPMDASLLVAMLLGSAFLGAGINALNQFLEHDFDALMERTKNRPIPSGRVSASSAFIFGVCLTFFGVILLAVRVNSISAMIGLATALSYTLLYTPLKRISPINTLLGAIPGALPTLIGWSARTGYLLPGAWSLFAILFIWQLPHFFSIAWLYREDYRRGGFKMAGNLESDEKAVANMILGTTILLGAISFVPVYLKIARSIYAIIAVAGGISLFVSALFLRLRGMSGAKGYMKLSIYYMIAILCGMIVGRQA